MKKNVILTAAVILLSGCGFMQNSTSSNVPSNNVQSTATPAVTATQGTNAAMGAGQGAGAAMQALYKQYKADGNKYDYTNLQNAMNTITLISNCQGLKENYKDKTYLTEFGKGLIASSLGLITQNNVQTVTNSLAEMVKNNETVQNTTTKISEGANSAAQYANTAAQYAGALSTLLGAFGNK